MSYARKAIDVTITLGSGNFGDAGVSNTATFSGLKVSAHIEKKKLSSLDGASIKIYGLPQSVLNTVTRLGKPINWVRDNTITLSAGDIGGGLSQVFVGTIISSYADFSGMPETCLNITALNGAYNLAKNAPPVSFPGGGDVVVIAQQIAANFTQEVNGVKTVGQDLQNWGVVGNIHSNFYCGGSSIDQLRYLSKAAGIYAVPNGGPNGTTVEIWPMNGSRGLPTNTPPIISAATGLVGAPTYSDSGVSLRALYQPGLVIGGPFVLKSVVLPGDGTTYYVRSLTYDLESETPDGKWFMSIDAYLLDDNQGFT